MPIRMTGMVSGLDTDSIVKELVSAGPASFKRSRAPVFKNFSLTYHERLSFWKRKVESRHVNLTETKNKKDE